MNVRHSGREDGGGRRSRSRDRDRGMDGFGGGSRRRSRYTMTSCVRRAPGILRTYDVCKIFVILDSIWDRPVVLRSSNLLYYVFLWVTPSTAVQTSHVPASFGAFHFLRAKTRGEILWVTCRTAQCNIFSATRSFFLTQFL